MNSMTFQKEGKYLVAYINGKEVSRSLMSEIGITGEPLIVEDITALTNDQCEALQAGDVVIREVQQSEQVVGHICYTVVLKALGGMELQFIDSDTSELISVTYLNQNNQWSYYGTTEISLGGGGSSDNLPIVA